MTSPKIEIEETNLEDLIVLGEDKLINILIEFPREDGELVKAKAKVKQMTMKELKNIDLENVTMDTSVLILSHALFTQEGNPFSKDLILNLPIGVVRELSAKILELSGIRDDIKGF